MCIFGVTKNMLTRTLNFKSNCMKRKFLLLALLLVSALISAALQRKVIDEGGSGMFKAEAVSEKSLPGYAAIKGMDVPAKAGGFQGPSFIVYGDKDGIAAGGVLDAVPVSTSLRSR